MTPVALCARALASAAQPATADAVLLVEAKDERLGALVVAGEAGVVASAAGHQRDVRGGRKAVGPPGAGGGHRVRGRGAVAVHARRLSQRVALLRGALEQGAVVLVVAHELVGAVAAVLDAVAALRVGHDLPAHALEAVGKASTSDVVAHRAPGHGQRKKCRRDANEGQRVHLVCV